MFSDPTNAKRIEHLRKLIKSATEHPFTFHNGDREPGPHHLDEWAEMIRELEEAASLRA